MIDTKALRQKVLDLAIRGKLVPQDPNDEPASVLLERIRAQKQQMVKEGKLKAKDIKNDTIIFVGEDNLHYEKFADGSVKCIEDEIPFDLPEGWAWCNLGLLFSHNTGKALNSSNGSGTKLEYITTSNVYWDHFELERLKAMPFTDEEIEKCTVRKGDLLVCEGGDIGRSAIWPFDKPVRIQNHLHRLRAYDKVNTKFYYYVLYLNKLNGNISGNGIGLQGLSSNALHAISVPVPPANEQERIAEQISRLFETVGVIDTQKDGLSSCISQAKSKILDLAIRGQLVPQDPNDEPASVLLERIRAEKEELIKAGNIKRDKKESVIFKGEDNSYYRNDGNSTFCIDDMIPFSIPDNWAWCNLSMIGTTNIGLTYSPSDICESGTMVLRSSNIVDGQIDLTDLVRVSTTIRANQYMETNDILICARNGSKALVGKSAIFENINEQASFGAFMAVYRSTYYRYVYHFLNTDVFKDSFKNDDSKQINQLTQDMIKNTLIPLPPKNEQDRITHTIEQLFEEINKIKDPT